MMLLMVMISPRVIVYVRRFETVERPLFFSTFNYLFFFLLFTHSLFLLVLFTGSMDLEFRAIECNHICTSQRRERDSPLD